MRAFIKGDLVDKATLYTLFEKKDGQYIQCGEPAAEINFEISAMGLSSGEHTFVVQASAPETNYEESDYSDEVKYTLP